MILYFSATGNGKYIAEQIAEKTDEKCMSIVDCICEDKYCFSNEKNIWNGGTDLFLASSTDCCRISGKAQN